jgi:hypothetical protein
MHRISGTWIVVLLANASGASFAAEVRPAPEQIAIAVQAAPEALRSGATVLGYDAAGALVTLREGSNDLVCLAHPPGDPGVRVACYARSLEPYMARGRELKAEGVPDVQRQQQRWKEAEAGTLPMPKEPAVLYVLSGTGVDAATGEVLEPYRRYVVYTPWATSASTGLAETPMAPGAPWIMFPGTAGAHIMINPPKDEPAPEPAPATPPAP